MDPIKGGKIYWPPEEVVAGYEAAFAGELQKKPTKLLCMPDQYRSAMKILQNSEKLSKAQLYAATVRARNPHMQVRRITDDATQT